MNHPGCDGSGLEEGGAVYGYHGRALIVNLDTGEARYEHIPDKILREFIGGTGLGAWLLYRHCPREADPLGPKNPLILVTSPLVGSRLTTSSKFAVLAKSPLTGLIGDSLSSSFMATELKRCAFDALVILGARKHPTLLRIEDEKVDFLDASDLVGKKTAETERLVKQRLGRGFRVACIGPAGESLVRFASISNDGGRQAGRTGVGGNSPVGLAETFVERVDGHDTRREVAAVQFLHDDLPFRGRELRQRCQDTQLGAAAVAHRDQVAGRGVGERAVEVYRFVAGAVRQHRPYQVAAGAFEPNPVRPQAGQAGVTVACCVVAAAHSPTPMTCSASRWRCTSRR